jgi:hypothetical protein
VIGGPLPRVVVLPSAWDRSGVAEPLGEARVAKLAALMLGRAVDWAAASFGVPAVSVVSEPPHPTGEVIAAQLARARPDRPLVLVVPELAAWRTDLAPALVDDLVAGCPVSVAPVFDGGFYLIVLAGPDPALALLPPSAWEGRHALNAVLEAVGAEQREVGMLRTERALRTPGDVRSVLADPLTDAELRALLNS